MKENLTELVFVLDKSGSMSSMSAESIGGFNAFLEAQKKLPGEAKLTLVLFDHEYSVIYSGKDIREVKPLDDKIYSPRGTTALLDAVGRTVDDVGKRLHDTVEQERPSKVLVTILTDGLENASKDYTKKKLSEMISHQREKYSWEFIFLAANQDAFAEGTNLGISGHLSMNYCCSSALGYKKAFHEISGMTKQFRATGNIATVNPLDVQDINKDNDTK